MATYIQSGWACTDDFSKLASVLVCDKRGHLHGGKFVCSRYTALQRTHRTHADLIPNFHLLVDVDLVSTDGRVLTGQSVKNGGDNPAGTALVRPAVDDNNLVRADLQLCVRA